MAKNGKKNRSQNRNTRQRKRPGRQPDLRGIVQGAGASIPRAFGSEYGGTAETWFDATHPHHLPLPRAVGPYSVARTTGIYQTNHGVVLLGPMGFQTTSGLEWSTLCGVSGQSSGTSMNSANGTEPILFESLAGSGWNGAKICPAAFSVQIMNPEALQTTAGMIYIGRLRTKTGMTNRTDSWGSFANNAVAYNNPRLCAAAKLAMRGVKIDAVPYNMVEMAEFGPRVDVPAGDFTWDGTGTAGAMDFRGFAPIFIYNPDNVELQYLITCEWRTRFDPTNPAQATHVQHPVSSDNTWGRALGYMEQVGHGVVDIVEAVQRYGAIAKRGYQAISGVQRPMQLMLTG